MSKTIQVFVTGGTFDKEYNYITGELYFKDTHLREMFMLGRSTLDIDLKTLMMLDSLEMKKGERSIIYKNCKSCDSDQIVITHGTDTVVKTAKYLASKKLKKTIVLTGAMVPIAFGSSSDGFFNLGSALAFVQTLKNGVYIAMNGRYYSWDNVKKNRDTGYFEALR